MVTRRWFRLASTCLLMLVVVGCHSSGARRTMGPSLSSSVDGDAPVVVDEPPIATAPAVSYVDRHPIFSKPRDYYENSTSNNKLVKTAAATFVGVPAGIYGEVKQIFVGAPPAAVR
jgi:hypothetical protein